MVTPQTPYIPDAGPSVQQVEDRLEDLAVEEDTIREIVAILRRCQNQLADSPPGEVAHGSFGGSPVGDELGYHVSVAHQHVVEAMREMVTGLEGYEYNVLRLHSDAVLADDDTANRHRLLANRVASLPQISVGEANGYTTPDDFREDGDR